MMANNGPGRTFSSNRVPPELILLRRCNSVSPINDNGCGTSVNESMMEGKVLVEDGKSLVSSSHESVHLKNFFTEVHAVRDVEDFLLCGYIILDLNAAIPEAIMGKMLNEMLHDCEEHKVEQVKDLIFTHDDMHQVSRCLQGINAYAETVDYDHSWICVMCPAHVIEHVRVGLARLSKPANFGRNCQECDFVILILNPSRATARKHEVEKSRTFATMFADPIFRNDLRCSHTVDQFKEIFAAHCRELRSRHSVLSQPELPHKAIWLHPIRNEWGFMTGMIGDIKRRLPHYIDDYVDGVRDNKSIAKSLSCTMFLYFVCILPSIAFGVLNHTNTNGALNVEKVLYAQTVGGLVFAFVGGTPQIVLLTTAPLAIFAKTIYNISEKFDVNFPAMYGAVGLWNSFFLIIYATFGLGAVMEISTRSSEEIFAFFISIAFAYDAFKDTSANFAKYYYAKECNKDYNKSAAVESLVASMDRSLRSGSSFSKNLTEAIANMPYCQREVSVLYLLLMLGTAWVGMVCYNFTRTPFLTPGKRELLADYAISISVIIMTVFGVIIFKDVSLGKSFDETEKTDQMLILADFSSLSVASIFGAMGLGFCLSLLFFMDQNITASLVNSPLNKMTKGTAYHWDLFVIAIVNIFTAIFSFPMVHAALPHSPLHVRALADVEERVVSGRIIPTVVRVRETRVAVILSHILIGGSIPIMFVLAYIPAPVLYGLFIYVAITSLSGNQLAERITFFFTEQSAYPPAHYVRHVPQRELHLFTLLQLLQVLVLCTMGFFPNPFLKMFFPVVLFLLIPFRHQVVTRLIDEKYLDALDHM